METGLHVRSVAFETRGLSGWDSSLLIFLIGVKRLCAEKGIEVDLEGLPHGVRRLLKLAAAVPEREGARKKPRKEVFLDLIGAKSNRSFGVRQWKWSTFSEKHRLPLDDF